jgi:hypothetical protein
MCRTFTPHSLVDNDQPLFVAIAGSDELRVIVSFFALEMRLIRAIMDVRNTSPFMKERIDEQLHNHDQRQQCRVAYITWK